MRSGKTPSAEELQLVSRFEALREMLLSERYGDHLRKPLAYWVLPSDRRLPLALLGRTLGNLLDTSFAELTATPGIGRKKIRSFLRLLSRVADSDSPAPPLDAVRPCDGALPAVPLASEGNGFDPSSVSDLVWTQWRTSVMRHGLGNEPLGRFAPSLKSLTRVIWNRPLTAYAGCTLQQIRSMKTHGEKRVGAVLEAFYSAHALVANMGTQKHLVVRIVPRSIDAAETWAERWLQTAGIPSREEIFEQFLSPLLDQIRVDAAAPIVGLAEHRLGLHGAAVSVRQAARHMGLTRARVYQLLNEINDIMQVRWPMGRHQVYELRDKFQREAAEIENVPDLTQFHAAIELFYPGSRRGAAGPVERVFRPEPPDDHDASAGQPAPQVASEV